MKPNKRIEFAPFGRPTRKRLRCLLAAHSRHSAKVGVLTLSLFAIHSAHAERLMCKAQQAFQLTEVGALEPSGPLLKLNSAAFYVDTESGRVVGGPIDTTGWGETKVYPDPEYRSFTVVSFTQGRDTERGFRTMYVGERLKSGRHAFQIADGVFIFVGICE